MQKYGKNTRLVEDVLQFVRAGRLLVGGDAPSATVEVDTLAGARRRAFEATSGPGNGLLWTDIRELEMAKVRAKAYQIVGFERIEDELWTLHELFTSLLRGPLASHYQDLSDDIAADLHNCATSRAVQGSCGGFFEQIFAVYCAGGWPCGWEGSYPAGRMAAYFPTPDFA
jgi:hypothetical protein